MRTKEGWLQMLFLTLFALSTSQKKTKTQNTHKTNQSLFYSLHYPASTKYNFVGAEDMFLIRDNCAGIKNALGWKSGGSGL